MQFSPDKIDITALTAESARFIRHAAYAPSTLASYGWDWERFTAWCGSARDSLPATSETVILFLTDQLAHKRITTVRRYVSAIQHYHRESQLPLPRNTQVCDLLNGAQRLKGERPRQKQPLTVEDLRAIGGMMERGGVRGARNWSILTLGLASALRRSNLIALNLADLRLSDGGAVLDIRREKRDQFGRGRTLGLGRGEACCPVAALEAWLDLRGSVAGPLYTPITNGLVNNRRMRVGAIAQVVQQAMSKLGRDPGEYAAHSLRAGFVTAALDGGANEILIAAHTGHRSLGSLRLYYRLRDPLRRAVRIGM